MLLNFVLTGSPLTKNPDFAIVYDRATTSNLSLRYDRPSQMLDDISEINKILNDKSEEERITKKIENDEFGDDVASFIQTRRSESFFKKMQNRKFLVALEKTLSKNTSDDFLFRCLDGIKDQIVGQFFIPFNELDAPGYLALYILDNVFSNPAKEKAIDVLNIVLDSNRFNIERKTEELINGNSALPRALILKIHTKDHEE
jgi:hypothetical protein